MLKTLCHPQASQADAAAEISPCSEVHRHLTAAETSPSRHPNHMSFHQQNDILVAETITSL